MSIENTEETKNIAPEPAPEQASTEPEPNTPEELPYEFRDKRLEQVQAHGKISIFSDTEAKASVRIIRPPTKALLKAVFKEERKTWKGWASLQVYRLRLAASGILDRLGISRPKYISSFITSDLAGHIIVDLMLGRVVDVILQGPKVELRIEMLRATLDRALHEALISMDKGQHEANNN
jgi:hypothetical protein